MGLNFLHMMYRKVVCFSDHNSADKTLDADDVAEIKVLGRGESGYDEYYWRCKSAFHNGRW